MWENVHTKQRMQDMQFYHTMTKKDRNWKRLDGVMFSYIYLIDRNCKLTTDVLPFSKIDEAGAGMYKGKKISLTERKALSGEVDSNANFKLDA